MSKFFCLMGNEWKKELSKGALKIMLIFLAVVSLAHPFLEYVGFSSMLVPYEQSFYDFYSSEIAWCEQMLEEGKSDEESMDYFRTELEIYRIMLDAEMDYDDWRYERDLARLAVQERQAGNEAGYRDWMHVITSNDEKAYFSLLKKNYGVLYANDPARLAVYEEAMDLCIEREIIPSHAADWRYGQVEIYMQSSDDALMQQRLRDAGSSWNEETLEEAINLAAVAKYRLENNVAVNPADSFSPRFDAALYAMGGLFYEVSGGSEFWNAAVNSVTLLLLVGVFAIVIAGTTVASEFSSGTVRLLLICPVKRWKILFSKYATALLIMLGMTAAVFSLSLIAAAFCGIGDALLPAVCAANGEVYTVSPYLLLLREYGYELVGMTVMMTVAFSLSTLTRAPAMAIGISVLMGAFGTALSALLQGVGIDAGRYLLFSNLDLKGIIEGTAVYPHQTVGAAVLVILLHMAVLLLTAYDAFVRREI